MVSTYRSNYLLQNIAAQEAFVELVKQVGACCADAQAQHEFPFCDLALWGGC